MSATDTLILIVCLPSAIVLLFKVMRAVSEGKSVKEIFFPEHKDKS